MELTELMDCETETVAEFATTADTYNTYHMIIQKGSSDIMGALEDTLHRLIDAGAGAEEIHTIMDAEQIDREALKEMDEAMEGYIELDLGYTIPGEMIYFHESSGN